MTHRASVAMTENIHEAATRHLLRPDRQEDLCFALWRPSRGRTRESCLLSEMLLPGPGDRVVHGNASFLPEYFERAVARARAAGAGIAFMHAHLGPGWQDMSRDDVVAEQGHAPAAFGATGLPLLGLTLGTDGAWSARLWHRTGPRQYSRHWCESVRVVGKGLRLTFCDAVLPPPPVHEEQVRTVSAWGLPRQQTIQRLHVGIVGAGSVGALVGEALARTGVGHISLLDFDRVERRNRDRLLFATEQDAALMRPKVAVLAEALRRSATTFPFEVAAHEFSVVEEEGFRTALDCDVLFSCVDRPWPRHALNYLSYIHLIPVIDGGIAVEATPRQTLRRADWRAHVAGPGHACLECIGQYEIGDVGVERNGQLDDPTYIAGLPLNHRLRRGENVFGFSMAAASLEVLQFLSMVVQPAANPSPGRLTYHFVSAQLDNEGIGACNETCLIPSYVAIGDSCRETFTGKHLVAETARALPRPYLQSASPFTRACGWIGRLFRRAPFTERHAIAEASRRGAGPRPTRGPWWQRVFARARSAVCWVRGA